QPDGNGVDRPRPGHPRLRADLVDGTGSEGSRHQRSFRVVEWSLLHTAQCVGRLAGRDGVRPVGRAQASTLEGTPATGSLRTQRRRRPVMTSPRRSSTAGGGSAAMRGALLIAAAVILGAGLLAKSFDSGGPLATGSSSPTTTKPVSTSTTQTTIAQPHDPSQV